MANLKEKLYQMFILGFSESAECANALGNGLGGIIFFTKDIQSVSQFKNLTQSIKSKSKISPFLSVDQEGGRVERTENIHNGKKYLSAKFAFEKGEEFLKTQTRQIARELKSYGINLNFAPCIDTNTNPDNPIIGERAFSSNPDEVINAAKIVCEIYEKNGIIPCVKHYPGHGDADSDSHLTLPVIDLPLKQMEDIHIKPFKFMVQNGIGMIMAAHLHCTCFDKNRIPSSLSKNALNYLRNNLNFDGVIVSDDMEMQGVKDFGSVDACIKGIKAGINLFIYRYSNSDTINIIEQVLEKSTADKELKNCIETSFDKIINLKKRYNIIIK